MLAIFCDFADRLFFLRMKIATLCFLIEGEQCCCIRAETFGDLVIGDLRARCSTLPAYREGRFGYREKPATWSKALPT